MYYFITTSVPFSPATKVLGEKKERKTTKTTVIYVSFTDRGDWSVQHV